MTFYVTIGQRYRTEPHPANEKAGVTLHPDGFITVHAETAQIAADAVTKLLGSKWSGIYTEFVFDRQWHPLGNLLTITA